MADDPTTQAIAHGVVSALGAAGLLQPQAPAPAALQQPAPAPQVPQAPPQPAHVVGDSVGLENFQGISKIVWIAPRQQTLFTLTFATRATSPQTPGDEYQISFPPNDASLMPELDRVLSVFGTVNAADSSVVNFGVFAEVQITWVGSAPNHAGQWQYAGELTALSVGWPGGST